MLDDRKRCRLSRRPALARVGVGGGGGERLKATGETRLCSHGDARDCGATDVERPSERTLLSSRTVDGLVYVGVCAWACVHGRVYVGAFARSVGCASVLAVTIKMPSRRRLEVVRCPINEVE